MRSQLRKTLAALATAISAVWMTSHSLASPPYLNYQGTINDAAGTPITNQGQALEFNVWDAPTGGNLVWGPFNVTAPVLNGRFNVILGPTDTTSRRLDTAFSGSDERYLAVTVGASTITPRQRFLSNPYAYSASIVANSRYELTPTHFAVLTNSLLEFGKGIASKAPGNGVVAYGTNSLDIVGGGTSTDNRLTTIHGNLSLTGSILDGTGKTNTFVTGEERLRVVRGRIFGSTPTDGSGFTVRAAKTNVLPPTFLTNYSGPYTVTFNPPFNSRPIVTVTPYGDDNTLQLAVIESATTNRALLHIHRLRSDGTWDRTLNTIFEFIAIGPR